MGSPRFPAPRPGEPCLRDILVGAAGFVLAAAAGLYLIVRLAS